MRFHVVTNGAFQLNDAFQFLWMCQYRSRYGVIVKSNRVKRFVTVSFRRHPLLPSSSSYSGKGHARAVTFREAVSNIKKMIDEDLDGFPGLEKPT